MLQRAPFSLNTLHNLNFKFHCNPIYLQVLGHNLLKFILRSNYQGIPLENVKILIKQVGQRNSTLIRWECKHCRCYRDYHICTISVTSYTPISNLKIFSFVLTMPMSQNSQLRPLTVTNTGSSFQTQQVLKYNKSITRWLVLSQENSKNHVGKSINI